MPIITKTNVAEGTSVGLVYFTKQGRFSLSIVKSFSFILTFRAHPHTYTLMTLICKTLHAIH